MKTIKYNLYARVNRVTEDSPQWEDVLYPVIMGWNEENEAIAKAEAYKGEYTIENDGKPAPAAEPTPEDRIAELEEALALLLSGVTE
jgi:hypothetical protein